MGGGAWWAAVHGVAKGRTQLSDFTFTFHFCALEKETAAHSSVLAWRMPGTGGLVGCRLWGHRVGPDGGGSAAAAAQSLQVYPATFPGGEARRGETRSASTNCQNPAN